MRSALRSVALLVPVLALLFVGACAKRPDMRAAATPAPAPAPAPAPQAAPAPPPPVAAAPAPAPAPPPVVAAAPAPPPPAAPKEFEANSALRPIHFDFDKFNIRSGEDEKILETNAGWLKDNRNQSLLIEGHADERGTPEYNLALGERRATSTKDFLVARGVAADRITIVSYGEERPLCTAKNEGCWAQNRRAMFLTKETR
jgi:peptidoglycan-associated lipoprotein